MIKINRPIIYSRRSSAAEARVVVYGPLLGCMSIWRTNAAPEAPRAPPRTGAPPSVLSSILANIRTAHRPAVRNDGSHVLLDVFPAGGCSVAAATYSPTTSIPRPTTETTHSSRHPESYRNVESVWPVSMVADPNQPKVPITFALSAAEGLHKVALKNGPLRQTRGAPRR